MRLNRFFVKSLVAVAAVVVLAWIIAPAVSLAASSTDTFGLNPINDTVQLGGSDLRVTVARVIKAILSGLGVIALGIVLYGGFVFMTAGGNEDKVATAKKILINGVIGLVIIMSAWGITTFVLSKLSEATGSGMVDIGGNGGPVPGSACDPTSPNYNPVQCSNFCALNPSYSSCNDVAFYVKSITPSTPSASDKTGMNNPRIRVLFSHPLLGSTNVAQAVTLTKKDGAKVDVSAQLTENSRVMELQVSGTGKLDVGNYVVTVADNLKDTDGKALENNYRLNDVTYPLTAEFSVDRVFDDTAQPRLEAVTLNGVGGADVPVYIGQKVTFAALVRDRGQDPIQFGGTGLVKVSIAEVGSNQVIAEAYQAPAQRVGSSPDFAVAYKSVIDATKFSPLKQYRATFTATDIAVNQSVATLTFKVYAASCSNGVQDGDETASDAGGSCGGAPGSTCTADNQCAPGNKCLANKCTPAAQIRAIDPMDGAAGSWITISGVGFGTSPGKVEFEVNGAWKQANIVACTGGVLSWNPTWAVVKVPDGLGAASAIRLTTGGDPSTWMSDRSDDDYGPKPAGDGLFRTNNVIRPALCGVSVTDNAQITIGGNVIQVIKGARKGPVSTPVTIAGTNLGSSGAISFGGVTAAGSNWIDVSINTAVPLNLQPGTVGVSVTVDGKTSNGVPFTIQSATDGQKNPVISAIDPSSVTPRSYVTIKGSGFSTLGTVYMAASAEKALTCITQSADASCQTLNVSSFPAACGTTWTDTQVIAEIPNGTPAGNYFVMLRNGDQQRTDGQAQLTVVAGAPQPSVCAITPAQGPAPLGKDSNGLRLVGANFSDAPEVYFWQKGAQAGDLNSWLRSNANTLPDGTTVIKSRNDGEVNTLLPVSQSGQTMITGPIKVQAKSGAFSNSITYTVNDCRQSSATAGYQCCTTGPDAGVFKPSNLQCAGETREAGYVWRFTTGLIPELPRVVEQCNEVDWNKANVALDIPSPTPWEKTNRGRSACTNASLAVRFTAPMDADTLTAGNIKVLKCKQASNGNPDCAGAVEDTNLTLGVQNGPNAVLMIRTADKGLLQANTWYRVQLSDKIKSLQYKQLLGQTQAQKFPLQATRPCGPGTAYCFDFKTGDNTCKLAGANILPTNNTVSYLGMLQNPAFPFETNIDPFSPTHPLYYYLWGKADQECSVISADGMGWQWNANPTVKAAAIAAPGIEYGLVYTDSRAKILALEQTAPDKATISASAPLVNSAGTGIFSTYNISPDFSSPTAAAASFDVAKVPLLKFEEPVTMDLQFQIKDTDLGNANTLTKTLFYRENGLGFFYFPGTTPNTFGLCVGQYAGKALNQALLCTHEAPIVDKKMHYVVTWDNGTLRMYGANNKSWAKGNISLPTTNNPLVINGKTTEGVRHIWTKFEVTDGAFTPDKANALFGSTYVATSSLMINPLDPAVVDAGPACAESCVNTNLWVTFNRQMASSTYAANNAWTVKECVSGPNGSCDENNLVTITDWFQVDQDVSSATHLELALRQGRLLKPNTYYKVTLGGSIKALDGLKPPKLGKSLAEYTWTFRTQNNPAPCAPSSVRVTPQPFTATAVGQRTIYTAQPHSSPNACSQTGQPLSKWAYGYDWNTVDTNVATVTNVTTAYGVKPFCSLTCLPVGSSTNQEKPPLCGNAAIDEGEDCDVADSATKDQCALNCVYTATKRKELGHTGSAPLASFDSTKAGLSYCGDGLVTKGETCDVKTDKGCTDQCLRRGTSLAATWCSGHSSDSAETKAACVNAISVCGNGTIEDGEMCEPGENGADKKTCNPQTCLWQNTCGTTVQQCDPKTKEGCTSSCTLAGSSPLYKNKSLCGDGQVGEGEFAACENLSTGATVSAGPTQIVEAVGQSSVSSTSKYQETKVQTSLLASTTVKGAADYRLQCGYQEFLAPVSGLFNDCPQNAASTANEYGVNSGSCCALRTKRIAEYPADGTGLNNSEPACRNTYVEAVFPRRIRQDSLKDGVVLVHGFTNATTACPAGSLDVTSEMNRFVATTPGGSGPVGFWEGLWKSFKSFFFKLFGRENAVATEFTTTINSFPLWCAGEVTLNPTALYSDSTASATTTVTLAISKALEPNGTYGVWLRGGKNGVADSTGVAIGSPDSHPGTPDDIWFFRTGAELCRLSEVGVTPASYTFTKPNSSAMFVAFGRTPTNQQIVPTPAYDWVWSWKPVGTPVFTIPDVTTQTNTISAKEVQGQVTGVAQALVTRDLSDTNNQQGKIFGAPFELTAFFCERPWPGLGSMPFKDADFNFSLAYCPDAGKTGVSTDDLPFLTAPKIYTAASVPPVANDTLKKYLFFNEQNEDVIGIQVFRNDADANGAVKSLTQWYQAKFQSLGAMKSVTVSGYEALSDGTNYYVSGLNYSGTNVYQNVYLFSLNTNAQTASRTVFEKLLASLRFNTNLTDHGFCLNEAAGTVVRTADVNNITNISCTTDLQCLTSNGQPLTGTNGVCSNAKTKFFRDWQRLHDVQLAQDSLDAYFATVDKVLNFKADLKSGTFIPGYTTSRWPSWGTLGGLVGGLPVDPINNWVGCDSADGQTCWNPTTSELSCPKVSRVYEYEFVSSTGKYTFHAPLEFFTTADTVTNQFIDTAKFSATPWQQCVNNTKVSPFSASCGDGVVGPKEYCDPPGTKVVTALGCTNNQTKVRTCSASCAWSDSVCAAAGQCGNGKAEGAEVCDEGGVNGQAGHCNKECDGYSAVSCGNGTLEKPAEFCEKVTDVTVAIQRGNGKVRFKYGTDLGVKSLDSALVLNSTETQRIIKGNGYCSDDATLLCQTNTDCQAPTKSEMWDAKTFTAQGDIPAGKVVSNLADFGTCVTKPGQIGSAYNANKDLSCAYDCKAVGGYCGDKLVQTESGEQCDDGNTNNFDNCSALCQIEYDLLCRKANPPVALIKDDADNDLTQITVVNNGVVSGECTKPTTPREICAAFSLKDGCDSIAVVQKDNQLRRGTCDLYNDKPMDQVLQEYQTLVGSVGIKTMTIECKGRYDGAPVGPTAPAGQCGNSKKDAGEACDLGDQNGKPCVPGYGAACQYCSNDCKNILTVDTANYCGNGKLDVGSPEVCETIDGVAQAKYLNTNDLAPIKCSAQQKGSYQCSTDCRVLTNSCVTCGKFIGKPAPRLSLVNPMIGPDAEWPFTKSNYNDDSFMVSLYKNPTDFSFLGYSKISDWTRQIDGDKYTEIKQSPLLYKNLWVDEKERPDLANGLETNPQCSTDYKLFFNYSRIVNLDNPNNIYGPWDSERDGGFKSDLSNFPQMGDTFDFPVNAQVGQVDQQLVYSPAVPPNVYRVVVRWGEAEQKAGLEFAGGVYNANTSVNTTYADFYKGVNSNGWCNAMKKEFRDGSDYWWPTNTGKSTCDPVTGVYAHQSTGVDKTFVQAFTINTAELGTANSHQAVAFYVKGLQSTIANAATKNVTVEIYDYHNGQSSLYSVFKPNAGLTYTIKGAGGSSTNPLAQYWHVFNFVYQDGQYRITPVGNGSGSIETDLCRVKANMPGVQPCAL